MMGLGFLLSIFISFLISHAESVNSSLKLEQEPLSCRQSCENYYIKNPDARPKSWDGVCVSGAIAKTIKHLSPVDCLNGAWNGVLNLPQKLRAYRAMVENVATYIRNNIEAHRAFVKDCAKSIECKRELARGLTIFSAKKSDGSWAVPDSEVDTYVNSLDIMSLLDQVHVNKNANQSYCSIILREVNESVRRQGYESYEFAKARYLGIAQKDASCLGVMGITFPEPPADIPVPPSLSEWFEEKGIQLQCYPPGKVSELVCYQIASYVVDPLTLTGPARIGGKLALQAISRAGLKKAKQEAAHIALLDSLRGNFRIEKEKLGSMTRLQIHSDTNIAGYLDFTREGKYINIDDMTSFAKNEGVGTAGFSEMVRLHPDVKIIRSTMALDNKTVIKELMANGLSCAEAMKQTPAYKIRAKFGFTKILRADCPPNSNFYLDVAKP